MDQNQPGRRPHYQRGRRGPDRRGTDRRAAAAPDASRAADQVDVEQIMRDLRARIAQRSGVELSTQQIQELAARRLEAILDPRAVSPSLMQQLRRGAATAPDVPPASTEPAYRFDADTIYESHRGLLRVIRKLLNPILKLFFNPTPLVHALHTQARLNREAAAREAERERVQMEWNALHYEIVQRLVTEVSRVSIEMQALTLRVDSLAARVDFNDRRVRSLEPGAVQGASRSPARLPETTAAAAPTAPMPDAAPADAVGTDTPAGEAPRRRRRRRRGRRGGGAADAATTVVVGGSEGLAGPDTADFNEGDEGDEDRGDVERPAAEAPVAAPTLTAPHPEPAHTPQAVDDVTGPVAGGEPYLRVREGLAQGAPPPPSPESVPPATMGGGPESPPLRQAETSAPASSGPDQPHEGYVAPPTHHGHEEGPPLRQAETDAAGDAPDRPRQGYGGPPEDSPDAEGLPLRQDSGATAAPALPQPTPPPDEPAAQPVPRDPGPPDR